MHHQLSRGLVTTALLGIAGMSQLLYGKGTVVAGSFDAVQEWLSPNQFRKSGKCRFMLALN